MLELPEAMTMAKQLKNSVVGKIVTRVLPPTKEHKFCWYNGEPNEYEAKVRGGKILSAEAFGIYVEISFDNGYKLCINDGVNVRLIKADATPKAYQLMIVFEDGEALIFTVAMYGGIILHDGSYDNEFYIKSKHSISPFSPEFEPYYRKLLADSKPTLSAKAFIATQQRFPGIGNGVAQDILFATSLHPKRKLKTLSDTEKDNLFNNVVSLLRDMTDKGGRDTEKDLFGKSGGYQTLMSKNSLTSGCPVCGGVITKEAYLGGSIYYCIKCQSFEQ